LALSDIKYSSNKTKPGKTKAFFICILIASFLWLVHSLNTVYYYTITIPVAFKNLPQHKKTLAEIPSELTVNVKASGLKLFLILLNRPFKPLEIDFNDLKSVHRNRNYVLSASHINLKKSLRFETQIKQISPDTLYFSENTGYQKIVPVKAPLFIQCREGYGLRAPKVSPTFITIWGDTDLVRSVDTIYTRALNLSDVDHAVSARLAIIKPGTDIYTSVSEASVSVEVDRLIEYSLVTPVIPFYKQNDRQVNIYPSKVRIRFTCLQNMFYQRDTSLFRVAVNTDKINPITKKYPVFLSASPSHITVMAIEPPEVEILILKNR
jgi:hypothetical protein